MKRLINLYFDYQRHFVSCFLGLVLLGLTSSPALSLEQVGLYDVFETSFTATSSYSNPYLEASITATFAGPSGQTITLDGFWDGGNTWKVRVAPTGVGTWTYTTSSADAGLNGKTGSFESVASTNKGHIRISEKYPHTFEYADGTPFFWLADTNWDWADHLTLFDGTFQMWVDTRTNQGFTLLQGTLYTLDNRNEGGSIFENVGSEHLNVDFFKWVDKRVQYIMEKGLALTFWIDWSECWSAGMSGDKYKRYARYVLSRYTAYNIMLGVMGEYEEISNAGAIRDAGEFIKSIDPYQHPLSTHTVNNTADDFGNDNWIDFHGQQSWTTDVSSYNSAAIRDRAYGKPVVQMEIGYENELGGDVYRKGGWASLVGGAFFTYGQRRIAWDKPANWNTDLHTPGATEMTHVRTFWNPIAWWEMEPDNSLVNGGFCLAKSGQEYIVYLPDGGSVSVNLSAASGSLGVEWFNPRSGLTTSGGTVTGGGSRNFTAQDTNDWILHIGGAPPDPTAPTAPQSLNATATSETQIDLTWQASSDPESGIARYNIYRDGTLIGQSDTNSFANTGLSENRTYTYEISAVNGTGLESPKSTPSSATTLADITPPTIISVMANGDPTQVVVVFSEPVEATSATNILNYVINNDITVSSASFGSDLKTVILTTSAHSEGVSYTLTVNNVADRAPTPNTIASDTQVAYTFVASLIISNLTVGSGMPYEVVEGLSNGSVVYIDRDYTCSDVPAFLVGDATYVKTANNDKNSTGASFITFDVNQNVTIYIAHDNRITTKPSWMASFTDMGDDLVTTDTSFSLFAKVVSAGTVTLGGNEGGGNSMYSVIIVAQGGSPPAAPTGLRIVNSQ